MKSEPPKIVVITPVKNEAWILPLFFQHQNASGDAGAVEDIGR